MEIPLTRKVSKLLVCLRYLWALFPANTHGKIMKAGVDESLDII